jgi:four helix bundle protein
MVKDKVRSVKDLRVWQIGMDISIKCYRLTESLPKEERYGLTSQIRRAAVSVPANIAEGFGRANPGDNHRFLSIAQGSLKEVETLLEVARRLGYLGDGRPDLLRDCNALGKLLWAMIGAVKERRRLGKRA